MSTITLILLLAALVGMVALVSLIVRRRARAKAFITEGPALSPYLINRAARITLSFDDSLDSRHSPDKLAAMGELWDRLAGQGFAMLAELSTSSGWRIIAGQHPQNRVAVLVILQDAFFPYAEFIALTSDNIAKVLTGEPGAQAMKLPSMSVAAACEPTFLDALAEFEGALPARALDARMLVMLYERLYATRMDTLLARAPTLSDMLGHAMAVGADTNITNARRDQALGFNRTAWLAALRVSLLDHGRRKLNADPAAWSRIEECMIAVHAAMSADEVIALLNDRHPLVARLGTQLKRQNLTAPQIFDEINRRLDINSRHVMVVQVGVPVQARLFALPHALHRTGFNMDPVAA